MVTEWEDRWKRMMVELGDEVNIPELWEMSARLNICPKTIREAMMLRKLHGIAIEGDVFRDEQSRVERKWGRSINGGG